MMFGIEVKTSLCLHKYSFFFFPSKGFGTKYQKLKNITAWLVLANVI